MFVVSLSPVQVKLGDFGVSKLIQPKATTTLHTQVSTQFYSAPEVLRLDPDSETSDYTNSVDIWSLGCVIYELLVGTKFFVSEIQFICYFYGKQPFPEARLRGLSPPIDDSGIALLKSMLLMEPRDRPTAADALNHVWLAGLKSGNECSRNGEGGTTPSLDERTPSRKPQNTLVPPDGQKKSGSRRGPSSLDDTRHIPGDVDLEANPELQRGDTPTTPKAIIDTSMIALRDDSTAGGPVVWAEHQKPKLMTYNSQAPHSKCSKMLGKKRVYDMPPICPQRASPNTKLKLLARKLNCGALRGKNTHLNLKLIAP